MKKYPFSVKNHAHDIEFYYNRLYNTMRDMEDGEIEMDNARYERICKMYYGELKELYETILGGCYGNVIYLDGKQFALAQRIVAWASEQRSASLIKAGKTEYLRYV